MKVLQGGGVFSMPCNIVYFALLYNGEIISVVSMRIPRQSKHRIECAVEVCRFATRLDTIVVGGFSKIFSEIIRPLFCLPRPSILYQKVKLYLLMIIGHINI